MVGRLAHRGFNIKIEAHPIPIYMEVCSHLGQSNQQSLNIIPIIAMVNIIKSIGRPMEFFNEIKQNGA